MSRSELSLFSYEVMGLVGRGGAGPHDLLRMARRGRMLDWAGESQYYVEPKRLARLGYLEARTEPGRTRPRTVYSLTDTGLEALLRLLIADLVGAETTRAALATLRDDLDDLRRRLDDSAVAAAEIPHRERPLLLVNGFLRRLVDLHEELVDEAERELR